MTTRIGRMRIGCIVRRVWNHALPIAVGAAFGIGLGLGSNVSGLVLAAYAVGAAVIIAAALAAVRHRRRAGREPSAARRAGRADR